tara:strand:- start:1102 stop:1290 length:189 start_codon:yes stop_codon:yes gene_type:complete
MKITEVNLKKLIKKQIEEYLKEISTVSTVQGSPGGFKGGEDEVDPEGATHSKTTRGTKNARK